MSDALSPWPLIASFLCGCVFSLGVSLVYLGISSRPELANHAKKVHDAEISVAVARAAREKSEAALARCEDRMHKAWDTKQQ